MALPESEVQWQILVRKYYSTTVESSSGKEKLKPLKTAESTEIVIGDAQVGGWRDASYQDKDKIEWQVIIISEGKELIKSSSTPGFDSLAKRAIKVTPKKKDDK